MAIYRPVSKKAFCFTEVLFGVTEMNNHAHLDVKAVFAAAVRHAIETVGIEHFKKTSMFGRNDKIEFKFKKAA